MKKIVLLLISFFTYAQTNAQEVELAGVKTEKAVTSEATFNLAVPVKEKLGWMFNAMYEENTADALLGMYYKPFGWLSYGARFGFEGNVAYAEEVLPQNSKTAFRYGGSIVIGDEETTALRMSLEKGKEYWYRVLFTQKVFKKCHMGFLYKRSTGIGLYSQYKMAKTFSVFGVSAWSTMLQEPTFSLGLSFNLKKE